MSERLQPIETLEDTVEVYLNRHTRRSHAIYLVVVAAVIGALAALPLVRVSVTIGAPGVLRPALDLQQVRAAVSGAVASVPVRRGQRVTRGDVLLVLSSTAVGARLRLLERRRDDVLARRAELERLVAGWTDLARVEVTSPELRQERALVLEELRQNELRVSSAASEAERVRPLGLRGLVSVQEVEAREAELRQARAAGALTLSRQRTAWETRRADLRREAADLSGEVDRLREEVARHTLTAPATGTVEDLTFEVTGAFVPAGEVVATVSPDKDLLAETLVSPGDVGLLRPNMPARVHVDAFNYLDWGYLDGRIASISADYLLVDQQPAFRVVVRLEDNRLTLRSGIAGELRKGMTVQARFLLAERTLLQLLRDDLNDWIHPWRSPEPAFTADLR